MENAYQGFTELKVWQKSVDLRKKVVSLTDSFPREERYGLTEQLRRSVRSIAACIAEGHGRYTFKDQIHFCIMARGSLSETYNHLTDALECKYIIESQVHETKAIIEEVAKLLNGYLTFLRNKIGTNLK